MQTQSMQKKQTAQTGCKTRAFVLTIALFFVISVLLSFGFSVKNVDHDCSGGDCVVCSVLELTEEIAGGAKKAAAIALPLVLSAIAIYLCKREISFDFSKNTPVSLCDVLTI